MTNVPLEVLFSIVFESPLYLKLTTPFSCEIYKDSPLTKMNVLNRLTKKFPIYYPFTSLNSISLKKERKKKNIQPTCSTLANTLSKLRPANFLISSSVHVGSSSSVANNWGYLETSSNPVGVLEKRASIIHQFQSTFDFQRFSCRSENRKRERDFHDNKTKFVPGYQWEQYYNFIQVSPLYTVCTWTWNTASIRL